MIGIDNRCNCSAELLSLPDIDGQEISLLIVSATWLHNNRGEWEQAQEPEPICFADEYFGAPSPYASLRNEAQTATEKRAVDVVVNGAAYAPRGIAAQSVMVELYAGSIIKRVRVSGDRFKTGFGPSSPAEFVRMPLIYERAFGGSDTSDGDPRQHRVWRQNPAGIGYRGSKSRMQGILTEYPNLEPIGRPLEGQPAGFGIISRAWSPRLEYAGTFDRNWLENQWPLLPRDFDVRHYQAAPLDQQLASLKPGDSMRLVNFTPDGIWEFAMPPTTLDTWLICDGGIHQAQLRADTVTVEPDDRRVTLVYRLDLAPQNQEDRVHEVVIGPVTSGYLRAKKARKVYLDFRDSNRLNRKSAQ